MELSSDPVKEISYIEEKYNKKFMSKISLKLIEFYQLDIELNGVTNDQGKVLAKGILSENLPLVAKYWLTQLANTVNTEKVSIEKIKEEMIKTLGKTQEDGSIVLEREINGISNPNFITFSIGWNQLLLQEKEIEYRPIKLEDLETVHSSNNYPMLFKFVSAE